MATITIRGKSASLELKVRKIMKATLVVLHYNGHASLYAYMCRSVICLLESPEGRMQRTYFCDNVQGGPVIEWSSKQTKLQSGLGYAHFRTIHMPLNVPVRIHQIGPLNETNEC